MPGCVAPQALLSALVARARDGKLPTRADVEAVIAAGCSREEVLERFARVSPEALAHARNAIGADR
jgi:hypothetical protein